MESLAMKYQERIGDEHLVTGDINIKTLDYKLRMAIGKTDDIQVARASHHIIKSIEAGESYCRVCGKDLSVVGIGRVNDYLALRHPFCKAPICLDCSGNHPDSFYKAFKAGLARYMGNEVESDIEL